MVVLLRLFSVLLGYAIGNINGKLILEKSRKNENLSILIDVLKTGCTLLFIRWATKLTIDNMGVMYAALGLMVGHMYPYWTKERKTNGMDVLVCAWILISFFWGVSGLLIGGFVVFVTKYLPLGQLTVPIVCLIATFFTESREAWILALLLFTFGIVGIREELTQIRMGKYPKLDIRNLRKK